jgi:hypothetical protein
MRVSACTFLYRVLVEGMTPDEASPLPHPIWQPNTIWATYIDEERARRSVEW